MFKTFAATLGILLLASTAGEASVRNFFAPEVDGQRLDSCLTGASDCGKPAADAFCKKEGYDNAVLFQRFGLDASRAFTQATPAASAPISQYTCSRVITLRPRSMHRALAPRTARVGANDRAGEDGYCG